MESVGEAFVEFLENSSIHGVKHVVRTGCGERRPARLSWSHIGGAAWALTCIAALSLCIYMSSLIWGRFSTSRTVVTIESMNYPIWNIGFPAVTLCNVNKVYAPHTKNITKKLTDAGVELSDVNNFLGNLSALIHWKHVGQSNVDIFEILEHMNYDADSLMKELAQPCEKMLKKCVWLGELLPCDELFRMTKSIEGYCCSFNYHALYSGLDIEENVRLTNNTIEMNVSGAGQTMGIQIIADAESEHYVSAVKDFTAIQVIVHDPVVFPEASSKIVTAQPGQSMDILVQPTMLSSSSDVRSMPLDQRLCWYDNEHKLRFSDKYNFDNCITECRIEATYNICQCIPFYYPDIDSQRPTQDRKFCHLRDCGCLDGHKKDLAGLQLKAIKPTKSSNNAITCDCRQACEQRSYNIMVDKGHRDRGNKNTSSKQLNPENPRWMKLNVFFKDLSFVKYRNDPYMTWDSLFATFGGIFGLCLGGSIISVVELFYYFVLRIRHHHKLWYTKHHSIVYPAAIQNAKFFEDRFVARKTSQQHPAVKNLNQQSDFGHMLKSRWNNIDRKVYFGPVNVSHVSDNVFLNEAAMRDLLMYGQRREFHK